MDSRQIGQTALSIEERSSGSKSSTRSSHDDNQHDSFFVNSLRITIVVAAYWIVSISMVFMNKYLLSSPDLKLDAPLFITWFQCVIAVTSCYVLSLAQRVWPHMVKFPPFELPLAALRQVLPLSLLFVAMIAFNNLCLKFVGVAFYYIGRSLTTVFNVAFTYMILNQKTSSRAILCCVIIIAGFLLGCDQESLSESFSISGVVYGVLASAFVALNAIYTSRTLKSCEYVQNNVWRLALFNNANGAILFLPLILFTGELPAVYFFPLLYDPYFWFVMVISGLMGFAIAYVTGLQIQVTSPLTHNISGTAKAAFQTILGVMYYAEIKSGMWWFSNLVVLVGSMAYTHVKHGEMRRENEIRRRQQQQLQTADSPAVSSSGVEMGALPPNKP